MRYGLDMLLGDILEDEMCRQAFEDILPGIIGRFAQQREARTLSVRQLAMYTGDLLPGNALEKLDQVLKEIGHHYGGISPAEAKRIKTYRAIRETEQKDEQQTMAVTHHQTAVYPGQPWLDVQGKRIQAHAGGFLYEDGVYYWYGENKEYTDGKSKIWTWGIRLYASRDFYNWEDKGLIIPPDLSSPDAPFFPLNCQVKCNTLCKKTSSGVFQPRHLRGRRLSNFATASTSSCVTSAKEVRLGKN